ncbi:MAG: YhgE/Pip family protein [Eggerthellaceae bacterium]|jgi:putative membrane protein
MKNKGSARGWERGQIAKIIGIVLVVAFFSGFYCWTYFDPSGAMKNVSVGIVNLDKGATVDGKHQNFGDKIVDAVKDNDQVKWVELDEDALSDGFENSGYLMVFEIPEDFSEKVCAGQESTPEVADMVVYRNQRYNFLFSQFTSKVVTSFESKVNGQIASAYTKGAYNGLSDSQDGFTQAADGAGSLKDGSETAAEGASKLASGTETLASGASQLAEGTQKLQDQTENLLAQTKKLSNGMDTLASGLKKASSSAEKLKAGSDKVTAGIESASKSLSEGAANLDSLGTQLDTAASKIGTSDESNTLAGGAATTEQCLKAAQAAEAAGGTYGGRTTAQWLALAQKANSAVSDGLSSMKSGISTAAKASKSAADSLDTAAAKLGSSDTQDGTLAAGSAQISSGLDSLADGLGSSSVSKLQSGLKTLASSSTSLVSGIQQVNTAAQKISSGSASLDSSTSKLASSLPQLVSGSEQLQSALQDGASTIADSLHATSSEMGSYVAEPSNMNEETYGKLDYYGQGFSPFFMTTALWLGALVLFFVLDPFWPKERHASRLRTVLGRLPYYAIVCALESLAVVAVAAGIGVTQSYDVNMLNFWLFAFGVSLSFMLIMQFLNLTFGLIGKALAILILIVQLAAAGGTLPVEMGAPLAAALKPFLPFTYAIDGFREAISLGSTAVMLQDFLVLFGMGLVCLALSLLCWKFALKRQKADDRAYVRRHLGIDIATDDGQKGATRPQAGAALPQG